MARETLKNLNSFQATKQLVTTARIMMIKRRSRRRRTWLKSNGAGSRRKRIERHAKPRRPSFAKCNGRWSCKNGAKLKSCSQLMEMWTIIWMKIMSFKLD